ncbi:MAG: helix-turn-helix transcriptional regulator [Clostridia bacterium]|nr:helix-turn-helix transcriptional regulator [Clostridia bacterium]
MFYRNREGSFKILGIYFVDRKEREVSEAGRDYTAIGLRLEGNSTFIYNEKKLQAKSGSISYIPAGSVFSRKTRGGEKLIVFHLEPLGKRFPKLQIIPNANQLQPLFEQSLKIWNEKGAASHNLCMGLLYHIFASLEKMEENQNPSVPASIAPGVELLQREFRNPHLTAAVLAERCGVSESYFRRVYRAAYGSSPWQTILDLRFRNACSLLLSGYYSPKQVSELCGFTDVKYFRNAFQKRFGISPTQYALRSENKK